LPVPSSLLPTAPVLHNSASSAPRSPALSTSLLRPQRVRLVNERQQAPPPPPSPFTSNHHTTSRNNSASAGNLSVHQLPTSPPISPRPTRQDACPHPLPPNHKTQPHLSCGRAVHSVRHAAPHSWRPCGATGMRLPGQVNSSRPSPFPKATIPPAFACPQHQC
jgi:hypothetical protein